MKGLLTAALAVMLPRSMIVYILKGVRDRGANRRVAAVNAGICYECIRDRGASRKAAVVNVCGRISNRLCDPFVLNYNCASG